MKRWLAIFGILTAAMVVVAVGFARFAVDRRYDQIRLGMTEGQITAILEAEPDEKNIFDPPETASSAGKPLVVTKQCWSSPNNAGRHQTMLVVTKQCWWRSGYATIGVSFDGQGRAVHRFLVTPIRRTGEPDYWVN